MTTTELDIIGAALTDPRITQTTHLEANQFNNPTHGAIWATIRNLHTQGQRPEPGLILNANPGPADIVSQILIEAATAGIPANADAYAQIITEKARTRDLANALIQARQALNSGETSEEVITRITRAIRTETHTERVIEQAMTLDEFVDQPIPAQEWVIPNLLAKGDRLVLTGVEGWGKSMLARQISVCAAAGIDPFTYRDYEPRRVLIVDCENPLPIMVNKLRDLRNEMDRRNKPTNDRLWIQRFPQGLDLAKPHDRLTLHELVRMFRPDLMYIGPAYKLYVGGAQQREEDLARQVTSVLDGLREEFGFALILEHHSPHATPGQRRTVRPIGSSLWLRWPEFGLGLAPADNDSITSQGTRNAELIPWRGARDERPWPTQLQSGGTLPWINVGPIPADPYHQYRSA